MALAVFHLKVTALLLAADRVTVNSAVLPSATLTSSTDRVGASSLSVMVPVASSSAKVALAAADSCTRKVSFSSSMVSWVVSTSRVAVVSPASMVTVVAVTAV